MRYLCVDPGGSRFGVSVADGETGIVTPLDVWDYGGVNDAAAKIATVANDRAANRIVVGLPTTQEGAETPACRRSHALAEALRDLGLDVDLQPEHLSSNEARRRAREAGLDRRKPVDHIAAAIILEDYLADRQ